VNRIAVDEAALKPVPCYAFGIEQISHVLVTGRWQQQDAAGSMPEHEKQN
jgi:hypothetical protein